MAITRLSMHILDMLGKLGHGLDVYEATCCRANSRNENVEVT